MNNKFRDGCKVFVTGSGLNNGKIYNHSRATVILRDPHYLDYLVKFEDGTEDWISGKYLQKPYTKKKRRQK